MPIQIRLATADDIPAIDRVRREVWFAAYSGILDQEIIDRAAATGGATNILTGLGGVEELRSARAI